MFEQLREQRLTPLQFQIRHPGKSQFDIEHPRYDMLDADGRFMVVQASHIRGAFYGLAVADALGAPVEFKARGSFPLVKSMLPNENFRVPDPESGEYVPIPPGSFTDDTSMALCLAESLMDCNGEHDSVDQVRKYLRWMREGYMSSVGECFDVGAATSSALKEWGGLLKSYDEEIKGGGVVDEKTKGKEIVKKGDEGGKSEQKNSVHCVPVDRDFERERQIEAKVSSRFDREDRCGNGSLMRVLPVALLNLPLTQKSKIAELSSITTHPHKRCRDACALYTWLVSGVLGGLKKEELGRRFGELVEQPGEEGKHLDDVLRERLRSYKTMSDWRRKSVDEIRSTGYVVDSLEAALWAFFSTDNFRDGAIRVVNLGDDSDTVGAIFGGLAGAYYGDRGIPKEWVDGMRGTVMVDDVVARCLQHRGLV